METIAALAATGGACVIGSAWSSSCDRRSGKGEQRTVSGSFGSSIASCSQRTQAVLWRRGSLYGRAELRFGLSALPRRKSFGRFLTRSTSQENSEVKVEEATQELEKQAEESKAAYSEAIDALKEETLKVQESLRGAYEPSKEKAIEVLRDTTEKLKEEAEKARAILTATAIETAEVGKTNLNILAENAPDPIKDIAETAVNAHLKDTTRQGSKIHDFCLGIPYGVMLVCGGLLWFIITGSTAAIRFGVILGGILLGLSVTSLRVWKEGKSSIPYIQGQAAIALIIFVKDARRFAETGAFFPPAISALASGAILAFYAYVYMSGGNPPKREKVAAEPAS